MLIKSPNKSHPFIKFFAPLLSIFILLISCSKPAQESANREATAQEETAITLPEQNESESKEAGEEKSEKERKPEAQETLSDGYIEVGSYIDLQGPTICLMFEGGQGKDGYAKSRDITLACIKDWYKNDNIEVLDVDDKFQEIICRQTMRGHSSEDITYRAVYKYFDYPDTFAYTECTLENPNITAQTKNTTVQVHEEFINADDDPEKENLVKVFENYVNTHRPYAKNESIENPYNFIDYTKGVFTNSGHDEYIVFFSQQENWLDKMVNDDYLPVDAICCFILDNGTILDVYKLPNIWAGMGCFNEKNFGEKNFGVQILKGWAHVVDFNQNGVNEIFLRGDFGWWYVCAVEFNGKNFDVYFITSRCESIASIDWNTKVLTFTHRTGYLPLGHGQEIYRETIQWNEADNRYWFISDKLQKKEE